MTDTNSTTELVNKLTEPQKPDPEFAFMVQQHKSTVIYTCCPETALDIVREIDLWETLDYSVSLLPPKTEKE